MAWRPHSQFQVDADDPRCLGICDRCGRNFNLRDLHWQHQWAGPKMLNLKLLVCSMCLDVPAPFLRLIVLPPDPPAIANARSRIERYDIDETDFRVTEQPTPQIRETEDPADQPRITENDTET